jgi:hypothetical protein
MRPPAKRLVAGNLAGRQVDQRLIVHLERADLEGRAQVDLELPPRLDAGIHLGFEEAEGPLAVRLGAVESHVGILEDLVGVVAVVGRERNADRGADRHLMAVEDIGGRDRFEHALGEMADIGRLRHVALQDGELVAAEPRDDVLGAHDQSEPLGHGLEQTVADRMAEGVVDRLEIVDVDAERRGAALAAPRPRQHLFHALAERQPVGEQRQRVVMRHEGDARLGALSLGDVDRRHHDRRTAFVGQLPREGRDVDEAAVGLAVPEGASGLRSRRFRREVVGLRVGAPVVDIVESLREKLAALVSVIRDRRVVGGEDAPVVDGEDEHRHRVPVEQQAEGGLAALHLGDVDAEADDAALARAPFLDQDAAAVGEGLLVAAGRVAEKVEPLLEPRLLAPDRRRIVAARDADAERVFELGADPEHVGAALVDVGVCLVPEDVAPLLVEKHDSLGQDIDGVAEPRMGALRFRDGCLRRGAGPDHGVAGRAVGLGAALGAGTYRPRFVERPGTGARWTTNTSRLSVAALRSASHRSPP